MKNLLGIVVLVFATAFIAAACIGGLSIPETASRYDREPEDLISTLIFTALTVIGVISLLAATAMIRGGRIRRLSGRFIAFCCGSGAGVLLALSIVAFWSGDPSSLEMRYLWLPAAALGISALALHRLDEENAHSTS